MHALPLIAALALLGFLPAAAAQPADTAPGPEEPPAAVTFASLLREMTDRAALARFPDPAYTCRQFSSYDRAAETPGDESWWANSDAGNFLRTSEVDGRIEYVMMDAEGPGAIVRIWSANPKGTLRVYLDDQPRPALEAPMADILSGEGGVPSPLSAIRSRGYNLYLPIPYAARCIVTSDEPGFYYQINYRTYEKGAAVESFTRDQLMTRREAIEETCRTLGAGAREVAAAPGSLDYFISLKPDKDTAVARLQPRANGSDSGMAVAGLTLQVHNAERSRADLERALRDVILTATFDGEQTIWCPVGDFFGSGVGMNTFTGFFRAATATVTDITHGETGSQRGGRLTSRWVMPFKESATIALHNLGELPVEADLLIDTEPFDFTERTMHFYARWCADHSIHTRAGTGTTDFNYVTIQNRLGGGGVYVGDTLAIMNPIRDWWGEGDEKIYIDGETFPSHFGTGTEDYYGYAWCSPQPFSAPFHAQPRSDGAAHDNNWGHATVTRTRALDAIPFKQSLQVDMEIWHWKEADVAYAATTYFYLRPRENPQEGEQLHGRTRHNRPPAPDAAAAPIPQPPPLPPPFKIEGAFEAEDLEISDASPGLVFGPQGGFARGTWSGESHLWVRARKPGDYIELTLPAPDERPRRVLTRLTRSYDYGVIELSVNGRAAEGDAANPIDTYNTDARWVDTIGHIDLGVHTPKADGDGHAFTLRIEAIGANPASEGARHYFGIDCFLLRNPDGNAK